VQKTPPFRAVALPGGAAGLPSDPFVCPGNCVKRSAKTPYIMSVVSTALVAQRSCDREDLETGPTASSTGAPAIRTRPVSDSSRWDNAQVLWAGSGLCVLRRRRMV
jgi:hypothetical protein